MGFINALENRKDVTKASFVLPHFLLLTIQLWPSKRNRTTKWTFSMKLILIIFLELGQLIHFILNISDIATLSSTLSTTSTTLQSIVKISIIYVHAEKLKAIIDVAYNEFWPSDLMGEDLRKSLKLNSLFVMLNMVSLWISAQVFAIGLISKPILEGSKALPFLSWFPFDYKISPIYEIIYATQVFTNMYVVIISILGHDFFFLALCLNVIAQYRLLKMIIGYVGKENNAALNKSLSDLGVTIKRTSGIDAETKSLIIRCIIHHNKLLLVCKEMDYIFSPSIFIQLAMSVIAICVSTFLITVTQIDKAQLYQLTSYCLGHVLQLFLICAAGNEVTYQSKSLALYVYSSEWYLKTETDIGKSLIMMLNRCQRGSKMTALGIFDLSYETFVIVMRLSFSMYTLLSKFVEKK